MCNDSRTLNLASFVATHKMGKKIDVGIAHEELKSMKTKKVKDLKHRNYFHKKTNFRVHLLFGLWNYSLAFLF